jgi:hypothetical protein
VTQEKNTNDLDKRESPERMNKGLILLGVQYFTIDWTKSAIIQILQNEGEESKIVSNSLQIFQYGNTEQFL